MEDQRDNNATRPESTVAQSFAADLDSMFGLSGDVDALSQTVEEKKKEVSSGQTELEKLEAKLRETEQRLARVSRQNSPSRQANTGAPRDRLPGGEADAQQEPALQKQAHPLAQKPTYPDDRPPTGGRPQPTRGDTETLMAGMPGAMPGTPGQYNGREDYVMVDNGGGR